METINIIFLIIGSILLIGIGILAILLDRYEKQPYENSLYKVIVLITILGTACFIGGINNDYKQGQIDALKGNYKYKMEIRYKLKDSGYYVPKDTIYIKIK